MRDIDPRSSEIWVLGPRNYLCFYSRKFGINVLSAKQDFIWEKKQTKAKTNKEAAAFQV